MRNSPCKINNQPTIVTTRLKFKVQILCVNTTYNPKSKLKQPDSNNIGGDTKHCVEMCENFFLFVKTKIAIIEMKRPNNLDKKIA